MSSTQDKIGTLIPPQEIVFTFNTIGWKVVGILLILLFISILFLWWRHYKKNLYRKEALHLLQHLNTEKASSSNIYAIDRILRRTAFTAYHQQEIKQMMYSEWKDFLDSKIKINVLSQADFNQILKGIYDDTSVLENPQLYKEYYKYAEFWIRKHAL